MGVELQCLDLTFKAGADLSAKQFRIMQISAAETVTVASANNQALIGILQNNPAAANRAADVRLSGLSKVKAGANITAGALFTADANGAAVPSNNSTQTAIGRAYDTGVNGELFTGIIFQQGPTA